MYKEIPETYLRWAIKETGANANSSPDLVKLANWAKEDLEKRATQARVAGAVPASEDPEVKAKYPPPPMSLSESSASWSMVSGDYTSQRRKGTLIPKRDAAIMDATRIAEMDMELPEEAQAEMLRLGKAAPPCAEASAWYWSSSSVSSCHLLPFCEAILNPPTPPTRNSKS
jgi:hypothetical protein